MTISASSRITTSSTTAMPRAVNDYVYTEPFEGRFFLKTIRRKNGFTPATVQPSNGGAPRRRASPQRCGAPGRVVRCRRFPSACGAAHNQRLHLSRERTMTLISELPAAATAPRKAAEQPGRGRENTISRKPSSGCRRAFRRRPGGRDRPGVSRPQRMIYYYFGERTLLR